MNARILVVDDEPDIRFLLKDILEDEGYEVDVAEHAKAANDIRRNSDPDLVLLDIWMPEVDGVTLLKQWKASGDDHCPVVMMSGHGTVETAVEATRYGAIDFVEKPLSMAKLLSTVKSALSGGIRGGQDEQQRREIPVGNSRFVQGLKQRLMDLRDSNQAVFLTGPDGCGKRIWAAYLSDNAGMEQFSSNQNIRRLMPLAINIYVEEIGDLDEEQQVQLHDAILASQRDSAFRFIVASRLSYDELKNSDRIVPQLLALFSEAIAVLPLDEHIEDIPELLKYYVSWYSDYEQLPYRHFDVAAQNLLRNQHWTGDIEQLKQFIRAILSNSDVEEIELGEIEQTLSAMADSFSVGESEKMQVSIDMNLDLKEAREAFEREYLSRHLELSGHNMTELARRVGQERTHLYRKLKALGLQTKKQ